MGLRLFTTVGGLVRLALDVGHPSAHLQPNTLVQWLSFMPQLEKLLIVFFAPIYGHGVEGQVMHIPISSHVRLPNLRWITTPRLEELRIQFFEPLNFSIPRLLHFMKTTENLKFDSAKLEFLMYMVYVGAYLREEAEVYPLSANIFCGSLSRLSARAQTFDSLGQIYSTVEHLSLEHRESSEEHNQVDRTEWSKLLRSFTNVKTLRVDDKGCRGTLSVYEWRMESSRWSCYPSCRSSRIPGAAILVMHSHHLLMPARTQAAPYPYLSWSKICDLALVAGPRFCGVVILFYPCRHVREQRGGE